MPLSSREFCVDETIVVSTIDCICGLMPDVGCLPRFMKYIWFILVHGLYVHCCTDVFKRACVWMNNVCTTLLKLQSSKIAKSCCRFHSRKTCAGDEFSFSLSFFPLAISLYLFINLSLSSHVSFSLLHSFSLFLPIYLSIYQSIFLCMYVSMYACVYIYSLIHLFIIPFI